MLVEFIWRYFGSYGVFLEPNRLNIVCCSVEDGINLLCGPIGTFTFCSFAFAVTTNQRIEPRYLSLYAMYRFYMLARSLHLSPKAIDLHQDINITILFFTFRSN